MTANTLVRLGSANLYDTALRNLNNRQVSLANLQDNLTSGKKIVRPSDDPTGAAQAERAITRLERIKTDQRALELQRNTMAMAESTLGDSISIIQSARELIVSAGNGTFTTADRTTVTNQLKSLRDELFAMANKKDTNGMPLFNGLGSALAPFVANGTQTPPVDYTYDGLPGQASSNDVSIPSTLDGDQAFMFNSQRDGVFDANFGTLAARAPGVSQPVHDGITVANPSLVTGDAYQIQFDVPAAGQYTVVDQTNPANVIPPGTYTPGSPITLSFDGLQTTVTGTVMAGDTLDVQPVNSIFRVLDNAIRHISSATDSYSAAPSIAQALKQLDSGMEKLQAARGYAGNLLNQADRISGNQETRSIQLESDRSRAEDLDMMKAISDFQNQQTGYEAALKSYAQIQNMSLFKYIG